MLHDMPKSEGAAVIVPLEEAVNSAASRGNRKLRTRGAGRDWFRREKVVKQSWLGMLLQPIGFAIALLLCAYALLSLGVTFWRSYQSHFEYTAAVHPDRSILGIVLGESSLPADPVDLVIKDVDGTLHKVVTSRSAAGKFVNDTILMLDDERARIKQSAHQDLDRGFALAFQDRDQAINAYADWFFAWKRSYVVMKESITSAITRFFESGKYQSLNEAVEADVQDYFLKSYEEQVLKPELRDPVIAQGVEQAVRHAHDSYRRVIANSDMRLQLFLAQHTTNLADIPTATPAANVKLDWDAQKWKAPTYLMQDRAFDGIVGIGTAAAGGAVGALALGPALNTVLVQSFGQLSKRFVASLGARLALTEQGAVAGSAVQPMGGQVVGAAIGVAIGAVVDYLGNAANEAFNRDAFVQANNQALDITTAAWKTKLEASMDAAIDRWFDDARASVVLASN
jgi:hypothetical protein